MDPQTTTKAATRQWELHWRQAVATSCTLAGTCSGVDRKQHCCHLAIVVVAIVVLLSLLWFCLATVVVAAAALFVVSLIVGRHG